MKETLPPPLPSPRRPALRVRASKKHQRLRKRELKTEKQARPTISRNSSSTPPAFKPRRTQMAPGYIGVTWPEKSRGPQEVCCRERRKQARVERTFDRKRLSMMERCKIAKHYSPFSRRRDGIQHRSQKAIGKKTAVNEMAHQADMNYLYSLRRQIASEKRRQGEFITRKKMEQHYSTVDHPLHGETQNSAWHSKHVQECEELERQLKELRNRSRALFEAQGRVPSEDSTKKKSLLHNQTKYADVFRPSSEGIGKKSQERMNIDHLNRRPEKEKELLKSTEISNKINRIDQPRRGRNSHPYQARQALDGVEDENYSMGDVVALHRNGDKEVQEMVNVVTQIGKEETGLEEKIGSLERSLPVHLDDTPERFHKLEQDMKEMHRVLDRMGREKFGSAPLLSSTTAQETPMYTANVHDSSATGGVERQQLGTERGTRVEAESTSFKDILTSSPGGSYDLEKKLHNLGHEFSHLRAGEETRDGILENDSVSYPVKERFGRSLAVGGYDTVAADLTRSDRGRHAAAAPSSSGIDWKSLRDTSIYSDADASARKKELDARVLTSTLLLYATTPPDESLGPKHHSGGVTEQVLDETSEERIAVAAFISNRDGDGVARVVQRVIKLYYLDGLQHLCLSRPTHNPKHRTRQVLFFKGDLPPSLLERIVENGDPPEPIPLDPPLCQHMGIKLSTTAKGAEDETTSSSSTSGGRLQSTIRQSLLVFSDLGSISEMPSREGDSLSKVLERVSALGFTSLAHEKKQDNGSSAWEYYLLGSQAQSVVPVYFVEYKLLSSAAATQHSHSIFNYF